ncbi:unnamed protein product [Mortierella alpina]
MNTNYVSKALSKTIKCTAKELRAIRDILNLLRPYAPKRVPTERGYRAHTPCVALQAPMVLLAQAILQALGLHRYTRRLSPWPSAGSCITLQVSPAVLFEILCSSKPGQFDIRTESGHGITTVPDAARKENKASVLGAFFDMALIHPRCREYRLEQANRLVFVNRHQVKILGTVIPHGPLRKGQPMKSHYEQRKAAKTPCVSASSHFWQSEIRPHELGKEQLEDAAEAKCRHCQKKASDIKAYKRSAASDPEGVLEQQQELARLRKEAYYWSKMEKAIKFMELHPDKRNHQLEEEPTRLDTSLLLESVRQNPGKILACGGGDPGLTTTLEVVPQTFEEVLVHLTKLTDLERANEGEQDEEQEDEGTMDLTRGDDASMSSVPTDLSRQVLLERIRLPKATRVSVKNLQDISFTKRYLETRIKVLEQARRGRRKKPPDQERNDDAEDQDLAGDDQSLQRAMESTSALESSLLCARNMRDVFRISSIRRDAREPLLQLKQHPRLLRLMH